MSNAAALAKDPRYAGSSSDRPSKPSKKRLAAEERAQRRNDALIDETADSR